jgi:hypothetical protein
MALYHMVDYFVEGSTDLGTEQDVACLMCFPKIRHRSAIVPSSGP